MDNLDIYQIIEHLPHRYPFLLVDKVIRIQPGESLTAIKNVTVNEPFFPGHFPQRPVMPGVLILEAMAQATGVLAIVTAGRKLDGKSLYYLVGIDHARFKRPVVPGDQMEIDVKLTRNMRSMWKFEGQVKVEGQLVSSAELMCAEKGIES